jgi:hypothetical protein
MGKQVDVFAYDVTVWSIVTGEVPFAGYRTSRRIRAAIGAEERPKLPTGFGPRRMN